MYYRVKDLSNEILDNLMKEIQEEKARREKEVYDKLVDSCLDILAKLAEKYPRVTVGHFADYDIDWSDIYDMIER